MLRERFSIRVVTNINQVQSGLVSVIMTNYNTPESFLREAIDSILNQTYDDFEFIIVDDASTDDSLSVIEFYTDDRIKILRNEQNIGLTKSLNRALSVCKGEFVARMDSDDISEPQRIEKQVQFLRSNPDVIVCGTWAKFIGDWQQAHTNEYIRRTIPERDTFRVYQLFSNNPNIVHPTAMFNRSLMLKYSIHYNEEYIYAQDYRMWISCSRYGECSIVPEVLLRYRVHDRAISSSKKEIQEDCCNRIIQEQLNELHLTLTDETKLYHIRLLSSVRKPYDIRIKKWMKEIIAANKRYKIYNRRVLKRLLWNKWAEICYFGLASKKSIKERIVVLFSLPLSKYPQLFKIRNKRNKMFNH